MRTVRSISASAPSVKSDRQFTSSRLLSSNFRTQSNHSSRRAVLTSISENSCRILRSGSGFGIPHKRTGQRPCPLVVASATSRSQGFSSEQPMASPAHFLTALHKFSRPHTMIGTAISILSISALAIQGYPPSGVAGNALVQALVSALLMNISIVGTNQIFDVEIDKINKPELPLASGELTMSEGVGIVVITTVLSFVLGWASGSVPLMLTLAVSWILGLLYSIELPFMRWKRSPLLAAGCILAVRAVIVQLGFYTHMALAVGGMSSIQEVLSSISSYGPVAFTCSFMLFFSIVIALFKDIPDVKGDEQSDIRTLSVRFGVSKVFWVCVWLLSVAYAAACGYALSRLEVAGILKTVLAVGGHIAAAALLWKGAVGVNTENKSELTSFYMFIWKLFYAEYLIIPFFA
eukprot:gene31278-6423_t